MKTIYVGLTGMSRAGKTVFLTSAIHELTSHTGQDLREFKNSGWQYVGNTVATQDNVETFPYKLRLMELRETPPRWPESTQNITEYRIHLKLIHSDGRRREGVVVFVDYPGERLVDIALLDTSYEEWSNECYQKLKDLKAPSEEVGASAREFLECIQTLQPDAKLGISDNKPQAALRTFGDYIVASRQAGTPESPLEPALNAISQNNRAAPTFFPLNSTMRKQMPQLYKEVKKRYARYLTKSVSPFLRRIAACNYQIVLVDVLDILRSGDRKHNEVKDQLQKVLHCYRKVNSGRFSSFLAKFPWIGSPQIKKVTFCATKADQATSDSRHHLIHLLKDLFVKAAQEIRYDHKIIPKIDFKAISAHRCTDDIKTDHEGQPLTALQGRLKSGPSDAERPYFPGKVPDKWPLYEAGWKAFRFPDFLPRPLPAIDAGCSLPSIKMDEILFSIVEELF